MTSLALIRANKFCPSMPNFAYFRALLYKSSFFLTDNIWKSEVCLSLYSKSNKPWIKDLSLIPSLLNSFIALSNSGINTQPFSLETLR